MHYVEAQELGTEIEKMFKRYNVNINLDVHSILADRVLYDVELKARTRIADIQNYVCDVQARLKLPLLQVIAEQLDIYIVASNKDVKYPRLPTVLDDQNNKKKLKKMELPYIVGHDVLGKLVVVDLTHFPHLLIGGSTNSGKTIGLKSLIASIACKKLPPKVNFVLIDIGNGDLMVFDGLPHLSSPIICEFTAAYNAIAKIAVEMERRIKLKQTDTDEYERLPRLVVVIDEFPALFNSGIDKPVLRTLSAMISGLLQRGRHAKIHLVLSAQNPTYHNMRVDLGNITARIAFKCAKSNYSETILGEGGAENLLCQGSLLFKSPQDVGLQWIQGIYVKPKELQQLVIDIKNRHTSIPDCRFDLGAQSEPPDALIGDMAFSSMQPATMTGPTAMESLQAAVMFWAFGKDQLSANMLMQEYHLGWKRASNLVLVLEELGIVEKPNGKQARHVRPKSISDLSDEIVSFMERCDYPPESLVTTFQGRRICQ